MLENKWKMVCFFGGTAAQLVDLWPCDRECQKSVTFYRWKKKEIGGKKKKKIVETLWRQWWLLHNPHLGHVCRWGRCSITQRSASEPPTHRCYTIGRIITRVVVVINNRASVIKRWRRIIMIIIIILKTITRDYFDTFLLLCCIFGRPSRRKSCNA